MDTVTLDRPDAGVADDDPLGDRMPRRPRRQFLNRRSAALAALLTCAVGFYAGARVEKGQVTTTRTFALGGGSGAATSATGGRAGAAGTAGGGAAAGGTGGAAAGGAATGVASGAAGAGAAGAGAAGAGAAGAGGFAGARGGGGSFGTVQSVSGNTLVLTEASGNTVKVRLSTSTKVTKSESVKRSAVHPGDTVVVAGAQNSKGTLVAATLTDSGSAGASRAGSGSSGSGGSGVSSLFSNGGGG